MTRRESESLDTATYRKFVHGGKQPTIYFRRDAAGHEIDLIVEVGPNLIPVEVKSGRTVASDFFDAPAYWAGLPGNPQSPAVLAYSGDQCFRRSGAVVYPWFAV